MKQLLQNTRLSSCVRKLALSRLSSQQQRQRSGDAAAKSSWHRPVHRCSTRRSLKASKYPKESCRLKRLLDADGQLKWGFVIYRTSYTAESDYLWPRFKQNLLEYTTEEVLGGYYSPSLLESFGHKYVEDRATLDGATVATLRDIFHTWRCSPEAQAEQPMAKRLPDHSIRPKHTRYSHCVRADIDVIRSVVNDEPYMNGLKDTESYVHLIDVDIWVNPGPADEDAEVLEGLFPCTPPLEGCMREDVGWLHLAARDLGAGGYYKNWNEFWNSMYSRPPELVRCL